MKLNIIDVLNTIAAEEQSVIDNSPCENPFEGRTDLDWYDEYMLQRILKAKEDKRKAIAPWLHITDIEDYYSDWLHEKDMAEYWNDLAARECDRLMWEDKDYSDIKFDEILPFDEWMEKQLEVVTKYMVVLA